MSIRKGSSVKTKVGTGKVKRIDKKSYSLPIYIIKLTSGKHKGEKVALTKSELRKIKARKK